MTQPHNNQDSAGLVAALRGSAPYIHAHHGRTFVISFGGEAAQQPSFKDLLYDIALLHSLGVRIVLIHGARPQISAALDVTGVKTEFVDDVRVTSRAALDCVKQAVGGLRMEIEALLSTGLASTPMAGARLKITGGNVVTAKPVGILHGVDHQFTGAVRRIDAAAITAQLDRGHIVLLSPVGYSPTGEIFNLWAEEVATVTAAAIGADKLVFLHPGEELHERLADCPKQLTCAQARDLLAGNQALPQMDRARLAAAVSACASGVTRAHLVSVDADGALLRELYTRDGAGTLVANDNYDTVRPASADDADGLLQLIAPLVDSGELIARTREQLELEIAQYSVMVRDNLITACCALFAYTEEAIGEVACVAVHPDYRQQGRAERLLAEVEASARRQGLQRVFVLTTRTPHWFIEHGFARASCDDLPVAKQQLYNYQRNSAVLIKTL